MTTAPHDTAPAGPAAPPARTGCAWCGRPVGPPAGRLALCPRCGAATTCPPPGPEELEEAYASWYRPEGGRFGLGAERILRASRSRLARRLDAIAPPGPILDVGCGEGALLGALRARGREAVGLERRPRPPFILERDIARFDERAGEWAAVVFWHSLEHLPDAPAALDQAARLLRPGGVCVLAIPDFASWQARMLGERWLHLDLPLHLVHLPAGSLLDGLRARGLRIVRVSHWRGGQIAFGWAHGLVALLPGRLDLYEAIRRPAAQRRGVAGARRAAALAAGVVLFPLALVLSAAEVMLGAAGTVYVEAVRP